MYENKAVLISFFPALIFSSSPKLNFFIKAPVATEMPAAGVASARSHDCMLSKALCNFTTSVGYAAYEFVVLSTINIIITSIVYLIFILITNHFLSKSMELILFF